MIIPNSVSYIDGDYTLAYPSSAPRIEYPFKGDPANYNQSGATVLPVVYYDTFPPSGALLPGTMNYIAWGSGTGPNTWYWNTAYSAVILEQEFTVLMSQYQPIPMNTPYDAANYWPNPIQWGYANLERPSDFSTEWNLPFPPSLMILVEENPVEDRGGGFFTIRRKYASIPPTRVLYEKFNYTFPGFSSTTSGAGRDPFQVTSTSRLQIDYLVYDPLGILPTGDFPPYPYGPVFSSFDYTDASLFLKAIIFYSNANPSNPWALSDGPIVTDTSVPTFQDYGSWMGPNYGGPGVTPLSLVAEIIVEGSMFTQWMGNIYQRVTRHMPVQ